MPDTATPNPAVPDPERMLPLAYVPAARREAFSLLLRLDERLAGIVVEKNRPIAAIKLAWWRESLDRLDSAAPPPEPLLRGLAEHVLPAGVTGATLARIAAGWDALIDDEDGGDNAYMAAGAESPRLTRHAHDRGETLFGAAAHLTGGADHPRFRAAGAAWALATVPADLAGGAAAAARARFAGLRPVRWPRRLRPLGMLMVLARDRLSRQDASGGARRRVARILWLGISGW